MAKVLFVPEGEVRGSSLKYGILACQPETIINLGGVIFGKRYQLLDRVPRPSLPR
jgi:hypothetical protein